MALTAGTSAPDFKLQTMDGKQFSLREALTHGPVVAAFFKISCRCANTRSRFSIGFTKPTAERM